MKLLYLSYWSLHEGLTQSSVIPHLRILAAREDVSQIHFLTIERDNKIVDFDEIKKVRYRSLRSCNLSAGFLNKIWDFILFRNELIALIQRENIDRMICRTSLAGAIGYLVFKKTKTPFIVESFEPHADYMLEAEVWNKNGLKYRFQKYWEGRIIEYASELITVSAYYADLITKQFNRKVHSFGCAVDIDRFSYDEKDRISIREQLNMQENLVGIYVGKFGGIYFEEKAYKIFKSAFDHFGTAFRLIILSPNQKDEIIEKLVAVGVDEKKVFVDLVPHYQVPAYLSTSDFAFSMVRPAPVRKFCSPIKDGEYWANGLPILSADGIGEDSYIIKSENGGALFSDDLADLTEAFRRMEFLVKGNERKGGIRSLASKYRNFDKLRVLYDEVFLEIKEPI